MKQFLLFLFLAAVTEAKTVLIVTADASDWLLSAGGTIATMIAQGDKAILVRVANDDKNSWNLSPEETAMRSKAEVEESARILGVSKVIHMGYREGELGGISPTEVRDRILFYIRLHKPDVLFIPNPYAAYVERLDRHYTGMAAEEARRAAALANHQPPLAIAGLAPHWTPELYYYAEPVDPRRNEAETTDTFAPQPVNRSIERTFAKKLKAAQALKTANYAMAMQIKDRLESTGRKLPLLQTVNETSVNKLVEVNVRKLAEICHGEEFLYAGKDFGVPKALRGK